MRGEDTLYEYLYQAILFQIRGGSLRRGRRLPSQRELCLRYNVGITTVRRVVRMLEKEGFIRCEERRRAVVAYGADAAAFIPELLRRGAFTLDLFGGLQLLMPVLQAGGAMLGPDLGALRDRVGAVQEDTDQDEAAAQASLFFLELLAPYRNRLLLDLQTDSEFFTRLPCLPGSSAGERYAVPADRVRRDLLELLELVERRDGPALLRWLRQVYAEAWVRAEGYLDALARRFPSPGDGTGGRFFLGRSRAHHYAAVARRLYRRIQAGEFRGRRYVTSLPGIMEEFGVSQATALSAMALLSDIGAVRVLDKKGAAVPAPGEAPQPLRLNRKVIRENLVLFLCSLQLLALCSGDLARALLPGLEEGARRAVGEDWARLGAAPASGQVVQALLAFLQVRAPYSSLRGLLGQLDDLLIWGHYLGRRPEAVTIRADGLIQARWARISAARAAGGWEAVSREIQAVFCIAYAAARGHMLGLGFPEEELPTPLEEGQ